MGLTFVVPDATHAQCHLASEAAQIIQQYNFYNTELLICRCNLLPSPETRQPGWEEIVDPGGNLYRFGRKILRQFLGGIFYSV